MNFYRRGYRAKLAVVRQLQDSGDFHTVVRYVGSRSPFDIVAIGEQSVLLCQVQTDEGSFAAEAERLRRYSVPPNVRKELHVYLQGGWLVVDLN